MSGWAIMQWLGDAVTAAADLMAGPWERIGDFWAIAFFSLLSALWALIAYKLISQQARISAAKSRIFAHFLGVYLFRDEPRQVLRIQSKLFGAIARYLAYSLPALVLIVPVILAVFVQLQLRYGWRPPRPGEEIAVSCRWSPEKEGEASLKLPPELELRGAPHVIRRLGETSWRIVPVVEGVHRFVFRRGEEEAVKILPSGLYAGRLYPLTGKPAAETLLLYPGQETLEPESGFDLLRVNYPSRRVRAAGLEMHWLAWYFILTAVFALVLKKPLKVDF